MDEKMQTQKIGFVMQDVDAQLVTDKVWHELAFGLESLRLPTETIRKRVAEMCSFFGLNSIFHKKVNELSGGQKQLVNLASVLALSPDVVILDEPNTYIDKRFEAKLYKLLEEINRERAIILVSHDIGTVLQNVKTIACVNETLDYHPDTEVPAEWLEENFGCPIEMLGHGNFPHRILKCHHHE